MEREGWMFWAVFVIACMLLAGWVISEHTKRTKAFIEAGYERGVLPGEEYVHWIRPKGGE